MFKIVFYMYDVVDVFFRKEVCYLYLEFVIQVIVFSCVELIRLIVDFVQWF